MCKLIKQTTRNQGFTLVELSIVIIIIGFLIAGIAAGTSLIKQAEISSVITDLQSYQTAYNNFILRYNGVAGDITNASSYWTSGCSVTSGDCNGNGDGIITFQGGTSDESGAAWAELSLANMVSAGIVPISHAHPGVYTLGSSVPVSKVTGAGYLMAGAGSTLGNGATVIPFIGTTNAVFIGKVDSTSGLDNAALKPEDAFNIDKKIDDGTIDSSGNFTGAITGNFQSLDGADAVTNSTPCNGGTANYDVTSTTVTACVSGLALN